MKHYTLLTILITCCLSGTFASAKPHAVIVVGTHHYNPERSMPPFARILEEQGFRCTLLIPEGNPEMNKNGTGIPGLEVLSEADLAIFFMRFLTLDDEQFGHIERYVKSGKPVVGFRTSTHSFKYPKDHPRFRWNQDFGRRVLGTSYVMHQSGSTTCEVVAKHAQHEILQGLSTTNFISPGTLYLTRLEPGCKPLVIGHGKSRGDQLREGGFGTFFAHEDETDIVAWVWENEWGGKVFCSSFGHVGDFASEPIMRILINGVCWAVGHDLPAADSSIHTLEVTPPQKKKRKRN